MTVFTAERTARKEHRCSRCGGAVKVGERYAVISVPPGGEMGYLGWSRLAEHLTYVECDYELAAEMNGRFRIKEIIKPDRDNDFYVGWSHVCEMPAWCGTRAEAISEGCPPSRLRRADECGTSMKDSFGCDWDDRGLIAEQRGFLPRARIAEYATLWLLGRKDEAFDLLEPLDGETEVRRD